MLLASLVVALLATLQLGDFFGMAGEFVPVLAAIAIFAAAAMAVFAVGYAMAQQAQTLNWIAVALTALAIGLMSSPRLVEWIAERVIGPGPVGIEKASTALVILLPMLLIVLVQWGLVRRRWLRTAGEEDLSRWPWISTVIAGLAILNPIGLAFVWSALRSSSTEGLREFAAMATAAGVCALVVIGLIECYIRGRMLRRRLAPSRPQAGGEARTPG
jgi:hypothetical protein